MAQENRINWRNSGTRILLNENYRHMDGPSASGKVTVSQNSGAN